jgi:hypothetical protein
MRRFARSHGLRQRHPLWISGTTDCGVCVFLALLKGSKATGLAAVVGLSLESLLSPRFWIVGVLVFVIFFTASRGSTVLKVLFFWIPTVTVSALGLSIIAMYAYLFTLSRHR